MIKHTTVMTTDNALIFSCQLEKIGGIMFKRRISLEKRIKGLFLLNNISEDVQGIIKTSNNIYEVFYK